MILFLFFKQKENLVYLQRYLIKVFYKLLSTMAEYIVTVNNVFFTLQLSLYHLIMSKAIRWRIAILFVKSKTKKYDNKQE